MSNENNGLITKIWGPALWISLHCITFGYPVHPEEEHKKNYKEFFERLGDVLPCRYCRESYKKFISTGCTNLIYDVFENRTTLTRWLYLLHEEVNKKLGVDYGITFDDVVKRYETFRASCVIPKDTKTQGCVMPLDEKAKSYRVAEIKDCPIIPTKVALAYLDYAKMRGVDDDECKILKTCMEETCIHKKIADMECNEWCNRNKECSEIIHNMRKYGTPSLEDDGEYKGLPTVDELRLIVRLSSNLSTATLCGIINKLPRRTRKGSNKFYFISS